MSDMKRVNPEVVKKAAEMAHKDCIAEIGQDGNQVFYARLSEASGIYQFNPLTSDDDAMKLGEALERDGWGFGYDSVREEYKARMVKYGGGNNWSDTVLYAETSAMRYLKCVSAMTSLPLYAEESMG